MSSFSSFSSFLSSVVSLLLWTHTNASDDWSYDFGDQTGPFYWYENYPICADNLNSPINLVSNNALNGFTTFESPLTTFGISIPDSSSSDDDDNTPITSLLDKWDFSNTYKHNFKVINNGHSISLTPIDSNGNNLNTKINGHIARLPNIFTTNTIDITSDSSYFCLHSLHFHWGSDVTEGSEHKRNNFQYPGEVHFVHYRCDFDDLNAAIAAYQAENVNDKYVLGVVGFWFEIVSDEQFKPLQNSDSVLEVIKSNINNLDNVDDEINLEVDIEDIVSNDYTGNGGHGSGHCSNNNHCDNCDNFWYYAGGLTTPGCYEIVRWHVFDKKMKVTNGQLNALRGITGSYKHLNLIRNWRPVESVVNNGDVYYFNFDSNDSNDD